MAQTWTIQKLLEWVIGYFTEKGLDSPRLSAEMLLAHVTGMQRIELYMWYDKAATKEHLDKLHSLVKRAGDHEPIPYMIGRCEFYSLPMKVGPDCLIPRPETELLVEKSVDFLRKRQSGRYILDLCTGSGCIAVAIAKNLRDCSVVATDICDKALAVAAENVNAYKLDGKIKLLCGDLFDPLIAGLDNTKFDLLISNPPYVSAAEFEKLDKNVKNFEPRLALFAGDDGLDVYRRIVRNAADFLKPDGAVILEIGYNQAAAVKDMLEQTGCFAKITVEKDFAGLDRIVSAKIGAKNE